MIGYWATLSLNIPDFTRYSHTQRDQVIGQAIGLPTTMALYSFIGVAVTSATIVIYGSTIWDPVVLITKFKSPLVLGDCVVRACVSPRWRRTSRPTWSVPRTTSRISGRRRSPSASAADHGHHRHPDSAVETGGGPERLHLHVAGRLFRAARADRRHPDLRLLCHPAHASCIRSNCICATGDISIGTDSISRGSWRWFSASRPTCRAFSAPSR